jgi:ADP-ribosylglycohydrolase
LAIHNAGESSRTTHGAPSAVDACRYFAGLLLGALEEQLLTSLFYSGVDRYHRHRQPLPREIAEIANGSCKLKEPPEIIGSGFVVRSLEAALWAFHRTDCFREGALRAVNLGDAVDTTGAIYGQLAGVYYGVNAIPQDWIVRLALRLGAVPCQPGLGKLRRIYPSRFKIVGKIEERVCDEVCGNKRTII